jgi:hypothetical protein
MPMRDLGRECIALGSMSTFNRLLSWHARAMRELSDRKQLRTVRVQLDHVGSWCCAVFPFWSQWSAPRIPLGVQILQEITEFHGWMHVPFISVQGCAFQATESGQRGQQKRFREFCRQDRQTPTHTGFFLEKRTGSGRLKLGEPQPCGAEDVCVAVQFLFTSSYYVGSAKEWEVHGIQVQITQSY